MRSSNITTIALFSLTLFASLLFSDQANAQRTARSSSASGVNSPAYYPFVIAPPKDRQWIRSMPIEQRPSRPLHVYGNRVRQNYTVGPTTRRLQASRARVIPLSNRR